ncbi:hypothetical protein F4818DRAFT_441362 [Hypoxylon cercidicola]|nr:hypothetical protein F4818DRAFT_441362 [Hypoxylon cercidicola]
MCTHSKTIYQCNHSQTSPYPCKPCSRQHEFKAGLRKLPCDEVWTHGRNNFRVAQDCQYCQDKKTSLSRRFDYAKMRLADLRRQLEKSYGECMKHLEDVGLTPEETPSSSGSTETATTTATATTTRSASVSTTTETRLRYRREERKPVANPASVEERSDPVAEFLRRKRLEDDAHLMMLSA